MTDDQFMKSLDHLFRTYRISKLEGLEGQNMPWLKDDPWDFFAAEALKANLANGLNYIQASKEAALAANEMVMHKAERPQ